MQYIFLDIIGLWPIHLRTSSWTLGNNIFLTSYRPKNNNNDNNLYSLPSAQIIINTCLISTCLFAFLPKTPGKEGKMDNLISNYSYYSGTINYFMNSVRENEALEILLWKNCFSYSIFCTLFFLLLCGKHISFMSTRCDTVRLRWACWFYVWYKWVRVRVLCCCLFYFLLHLSPVCC